jgi:hypothetical protein
MVAAGSLAPEIDCEISWRDAVDAVSPLLRCEIVGKAVALID